MQLSRSDALAGVRVLDAGSMLAGPYATMLLAGMGAEVIKVEPPTGDPARYAFGPPFEFGDSTYFQAVNQDKRSLALDLGDPRGREVLGRLVETCDVIVHNLRPAPAAKLGLDEDAIRNHRPDIVYGLVRAFGETGPWSNRPGMDLVFQGLSGHMSLTGDPDGDPVRSAAQVVDVATGSYLAAGLAAALFHRERTGEGRRVEVNLIDVGFALQNTLFSYFFSTGKNPERLGSGSYVSLTNCFKTSDAWVNVTIPHEVHWQSLCRAVGRTDLLEDARFATNEQRVLARKDVEAELRPIFTTASTAYWLDQLTEALVPCGPVSSYSEAVSHPQTVANGIIADLPHPDGAVRGVLSPIRICGEAAGAHSAPPPLGQHSEELTQELGYGQDDRRRLVDAGVLRVPATASQHTLAEGDQQ